MATRQSTKVAFTCVCCGSPFYAFPSAIKQGRTRFCSRDCYEKSRVRPLIDRFLGHVGIKQPSGCILWTGSTNLGGYGQIRDAGRLLLATRVSYGLFVGPVSDDLNVLHRCDTPLCVNPSHLFLGTQADNVADMEVKGRSLKGEACPWSGVTADQVREARRLYAAGGVSHADLAKRLRIPTGNIRNIVGRRTWKHI